MALVVGKGKVVHVGRLRFRAGDVIPKGTLPPDGVKGLIDAGAVEEQVDLPDVPSTEGPDDELV